MIDESHGIISAKRRYRRLSILPPIVDPAQSCLLNFPLLGKFLKIVPGDRPPLPPFVA